MTEKVQFNVFRYKHGQPAPYYDTFEVTADENTTVLVALQTIRREHDHSLALRHSCHHASCGTCGMRVNGKEVLSCVVNVLELGTPTVVVEPLRHLPLISDLVVDMTDFYDHYTAAEMPYVRRSEFLPEAAAPAGVDHFMRYENCVECGLCTSVCPVAGSDPAYWGPAALAAAWRAVAETREQETTQATAVLHRVDNEQGCWRCHLAYECSEVCPSDVDPAAAIMALRRRLVGRKIRRLFGLN